MGRSWSCILLALAVSLKEATSMGIVMGPWANYLTVSQLHSDEIVQQN